MDQEINFIFFDGYYKDIWKKVIPSKASIIESNFLIEVCNLKEHAHVLDLMCGYGRHAIELAKQNIQITAIDIQKDYIKEIDFFAKTEALPINAINSNILTVEYGSQFDAALCMGNSFSVLNYETAIKILTKINSSLKTDGKLVIDTWMLAEIINKGYKKRDWSKIEDFYYLVENEYCFNPTRLESHHIMISKKETEIKESVDYILSINEYSKLLNTTGFKIENIFSTPNKSIFKFGDPRAYIVCKKT